MTPGARVQAAIDVLETWKTGVPVERALTQWARGARFAGSKDRAAVRDHVYDVLRNKGRVTALGSGDTGRAWMIGLCRLNGEDPANVFDGVGYGPAALSPSETIAGPSADIYADTPEWLMQRLSPAHGADLDPILSAFSSRAPLYLRVNLRRSSLIDVQVNLEADGVTAHPISGIETALEIEQGARRLQQSKAYKAGLVEPQDLSVQAALADVSWPSAGRILDYCAGGGGKALAVADASRAEIYAHDIDPKRMRDLAPRARRSGVKIVELATSDVSTKAPFDAVLCDVPCSGSGTWRRDPEAKWHLTPDRLESLKATQAGILQRAADLTTQNGKLIYMTCSLLPEENSQQIQSFMAAHPEWVLEHDRQFTPLTHSDGFYVAQLTRKTNG